MPLAATCELSLVKSGFQGSDAALVVSPLPAAGNPIVAPPCLNPAKWLLSIDEPTCSYRESQRGAGPARNCPGAGLHERSTRRCIPGL